MKNSFFALSDPNPVPIKPESNMIGDIIFSWNEAISLTSGAKFGPTRLINKSDEKNTKILIISNIRVEILLMEFINILLSSLFLSANKVTIELCNGPLTPPRRTKKKPGRM